MEEINREIRKYSRKWKEKNQLYIKELQHFFDIVDNIEDEKMKKAIINQMLKCDEILTRIVEKEFINKV